MARIAVVGVGAIGGVAAGLLAATGEHELTLCTRRPLGSLTVTTPEGPIEVRARDVTEPSEAGLVDWVLVATKAYDAEGASVWLRRLCEGGAPVAVLQNGVEHRERFAAAVSPERILPVVIDCPAERRGDGNIVQRGPAQMRVEDSALGAEFAALFGGSKLEGGPRAEVELTGDFVSAAWHKLCINAAAAVSALLMRPAGVLREEEPAQLALEIVAECAAVGRAEGARLAEDIGEQILARYRALPADSINSILADRMAGRPMEIDARNGVIVRRGERHGIGTPVNRTVVRLLRALSPA